jgi:hypothetical protein
MMGSRSGHAFQHKSLHAKRSTNSHHTPRFPPFIPNASPAHTARLPHLRTRTHTHTHSLSLRCPSSHLPPPRAARAQAIAHDANAATITAALEGLTTIGTDTMSTGDVTVAVSGGGTVCVDGTGTAAVTFKTNTGNLPMMRVDATMLTRGSGSVALSVAETTPGTRENLVCNGRGTCDHKIGQCVCYAITMTSYYQGGNGLQAAAVAAGTRGDCGYWPGTRGVPYCPGTTACSSVGLCDLTVSNSVNVDRCTCATGYTGGDCALRLCPKGAAWFDEATAADTAHAPAECSNRGECNRASGQCKCMGGFEGSACERTGCPDKCNGNGVCVSNARQAELRKVNHVLAPLTYGAGTTGKVGGISFRFAQNKHERVGARCGSGGRW